MDFKSLEDLVSYVENKNLVAMKEVAKDMVTILEDEIRDQIRGWDDRLFDAPRVVNTSNNHAEVEVEDDLGWTSVVTGENVTNALYMTEGGYTWGRETSNIMDESERKMESDIPDEYLKIMNSMGVPIK